jgi:SAM-dependent methyltransferase
VPVKPRSQVLQIRCGLGESTANLLHRLDQASRIIDLETAQGLLDRARANVAAEQVGRRIFFRLQSLDAHLPFGDDTFDLVLANVGLVDLARPDEFLADLVRVARPGAEVRVASPLRGTWGEFLDVFRDVLVRLGRDDALASLRGYAASFPEAGGVVHQMEHAGLQPGHCAARPLGAGVSQRARILLRAGRRIRAAGTLEENRRHRGRSARHFLGGQTGHRHLFFQPIVQREHRGRAFCRPKAGRTGQLT